MRILIVSDNPTVSLLLSATLTKWGYPALRAADGLQALDELSKADINLVISDYDMPNLDGLGLCREVRARTWAGYVYLLLFTAKDNRDDFIRGMEAGADDFLAKPVDFAELRVRLRAAKRVIDLERELQRQNRELRNAYKILDADLRSAGRLQTSLLPDRVSPCPELDFDWLFLPSHYVAGDMFNFLQLDRDHVAVYHLDVAGHGIPAALLSVALSRVLSTETGLLRGREDRKEAVFVPPAELVGLLNQRFQGGHDDIYFTIFYGIFHRPSRQLRYCQAGHPSPVLLRAGEIPSLVGQGGFPVGMMPGMEYEEFCLTLEPRDRLVLYSDGLTDLKNSTGEAFTAEGLVKSLGNSEGLALENLIRNLNRDISEWCGTSEYADDISLLVVQSNSKAQQ